MDLEEKIEIVKRKLNDRKVAIGFSGGADSTLIAYLSSKVAEDTLAITINNHLLPTDFVENTKKITELLEIKHDIININFFDNHDFLSNDSKRCYDCRSLMYSQIEKSAKKKGFDFICDGNNISDLVIDRPGILVTYKMGFNTPLIEAKLTSKEIHEYLNENNIPYSRSTTCLATRIPTNTPITRKKVKRISKCEDYFLENTNCEIVKLRDLGDYAICETDNINEILKDDKYTEINEKLKENGFKKVALNLEPLDDDEFIIIEQDDDSFFHKLPFSINLKNTKENIKHRIQSENGERIDLERISIHRDGLIKIHGAKTYEDALDTFIEILPKLRREI